MTLVYFFYFMAAVVGAIFMAIIGVSVAAYIDKPKWAGAIIGTLLGIVLGIWWTSNNITAQEDRSTSTQLAYSLYSIGVDYDENGQYDQALDYYNQALEMHRELGDRSGEGKALYSIGAVYEKMGHFNQALNYYNQALVIYQARGDPIMKSRLREAIKNLPSE